jgi:CRP-like cAMP-binding protein
VSRSSRSDSTCSRRASRATACSSSRRQGDLADDWLGREALAIPAGRQLRRDVDFDRSERSTDAIANTTCTLITISRSDFELLLDFNRDIAYRILWSVVRLLSARLRVTNDNLRSFLAMSMF